MPELFPRRTFTGFGPSALTVQDEEPTLTSIEGKRPGVLRTHVRACCPRRPGTYGMIDATGELIYVGKAKSLRSRLLSYFRTKSRDPKAGRIIRQAKRIVWEPQANEFAALLRELELIRRWCPRWNVQGQPIKRKRYFICIGRKPAPYVFVSQKLTGTIDRWYGPVPAGGRVREAVRRLNDHFQLRDCPRSQQMYFRDQQELFPLERAPGCIRFDIGTCTAPCAAKVTKAEYEQQTNAVADLLEGRSLDLIHRLAQEVQSASALQQFERAASLQAQVEVLTWLTQHLERLRVARELSFVYEVAGTEDNPRWYLIHRGDLKGVLRVPTTDEAKQEARLKIEQVYADHHGVRGGRLTEQIERSMLIAAWFRRETEEREGIRSVAKTLADCCPGQPLSSD